MSLLVKIALLSLLTSPFALAQQDLLALSGTGEAWSIDSLTGQEVSLGTCGFDMVSDLTPWEQDTALAAGYDRNSGFYALFSVISVDGRGTLLTPLNLSSMVGSPAGLATDGTKTIYLATTGGYLFTIDPLTGDMLTQAKTGAFDVESMTYFNGLLWLWDTRRGLLTMDPARPEYASEVAPSQTGAREISAIHFLPSGELRGVGRGYWSIDTRTSDYTLLADISVPPLFGLTERDAGGPPPGPIYQITNLVSGMVTTLSISQAQPNGAIIFAYSLAGPGPTPTPFGDAAMSAPISQMPPFASNAQGELDLPVLLPNGTSGLSIWTQAAELYTGGGGILSNPLALTVQ